MVRFLRRGRCNFLHHDSLRVWHLSRSHDTPQGLAFHQLSNIGRYSNHFLLLPVSASPNPCICSL